MEKLTTKNLGGVPVYTTGYECERCGEILFRLPDYGNGSPTATLHAYESTDLTPDEIGALKVEVLALREALAQKQTGISLRGFCEKSLSNDLIGVVEDIMHGEPAEVKPAYRILLDGGDVLSKQVKRFTFVKRNNRAVAYVQLQ